MRRVRAHARSLFAAPWLCSGLLSAEIGCTDPDPGPNARPCGRPWCQEAEGAGLQAAGPMHGRGAAFVDVDGDGWEDLWQSDTTGGSCLYRNRGDGTFELFDTGIAPSALASNWAGVWGDIDNDGDPDLFLVNGGYEGELPCALYRNDVPDGGSFVDVTTAARLKTLDGDWWGASFADFDRDSLLDLVVTRIGLTGAAPMLLLYHNRGDGTFEEISESVGLTPPAGLLKNPVWLDYDRDGDPDLYIAMGEYGEHALFRNDGGTWFSRVPFDLDPELPVDNSFEIFHAFCAAADDFNQDGWDDLYLGRWSYQDYVFLNKGDGTFGAAGAEVGLDMAVHPMEEENTMGLAVGDLDDDGWPDLLIGTGAPFAARVPLAYCSNGDSFGFHRCSDDFLEGHGISWHHGAALGDPDHDGDTDIFWSLGGHRGGGEAEDELAAYYVRYPEKAPSTAVVHLVGTASNRSAVGARLEVTGSRTHYYTVRSSQGFASQNSDWLPVSLSGSGRATVRVFWPSGRETEVFVSPGDRIEIVE